MQSKIFEPTPAGARKVIVYLCVMYDIYKLYIGHLGGAGYQYSRDFTYHRRHHLRD